MRLSRKRNNILIKKILEFIKEIFKDDWNTCPICGYF